MTIAHLLTGAIPGVGTMIMFALLLGVFAIGAPGVPGGTVMASLGIVVSVLGFQENAVALLLAIFALQDSFGTACNVTGDGALALMIDGIYNPKAENLQTGE
jgi:Na+/H+-dicarboxylate symporter